MTRSTVKTGFWLVLAFVSVIGTRPARAADEGSIHGTVLDQLGGRVSGASVALLRNGENTRSTTTNPRGEFAFEAVAAGRYQIDVTAEGFSQRITDPLFVGASGRVNLEVNLQISGVQVDVLVTAAAASVPASQIGAAATRLDASALEALGNPDLLEPIRSVPGVAVVQTAGRGGTTSLFVRGGTSTFNKVLIDGIPANDVGGAIDLADLATTAIESVEVLRASNSVLYGSDAMTGVVSLTTRRGQSRIPEAMVSLDGGNLATTHQDFSVGGAANRLDYFADYSHFQTDNSVPNNEYRNHTFATRVGARLGSDTDLSGTVRWIDTKYGSPNAFAFYGVADDSVQTRTTSYTSITAQTMITSRWQSTIRFGLADRDTRYVNPSPTGTPSDPSAFANFLGNVVTITGANGYTVTGRAILDYSDAYPSTFDSSNTRKGLYAQTDYHVSSVLDLAGGIRLENEQGATISSFGTDKTDRTNYGAFVEARAAALGHVYVTGGFGVEHNAVFGTETTPRVSVAAYLRQPSSTDALGDTKVTFNAGKGIKAPDVSQELSSLNLLIPAATASSLGIGPIGPERSRTLDIGVEQGLARGRGRVRIAYFNNEFSDLVEYVSKGVLPQLGIPASVLSSTQFGAYVNSQSNRARGVELSGEAHAGPVKVTAAYMYLDALVTESFSSAVLFPAENPAFPGIQIGQYTPLVGNRPFARPTNSGSLTVRYAKERVQLALAGYFFGVSDSSTFLSDAFFGYSMLLPNQDLAPAYQKFDISGSYRIHPRARAYVTLENAFDKEFQASTGFPSLPRTVQAGVTITLGGNGRRP